MDDVTVARALHVLAVVLWIGGVGFVTTALLPALRRMPDAAQRLTMFEATESRFGNQAKVIIIVAGLSGFYMLVRMDAWDRFTSLPYWWMHAMVLVWAMFALMLFVLEPFVLHRWFAVRARDNPDATFLKAAPLAPRVAVRTYHYEKVGVLGPRSMQPKVVVSLR